MKKTTIGIIALLFTGACTTIQASATILDTQTTPGYGKFVPDTSTVGPEKPGGGGPIDPNGPDIAIPVPKGSLGISQIPKGFNFGENPVSVEDSDLPTKVFAQKNIGINGTAYVGTRQHVSVWDGRLVNNDWELSVKATAFRDVNAGTDTLNGASIRILGAELFSHYLEGLSAGTGGNTQTILEAPPASLTIQTNDSTLLVTKSKSGQRAKKQTDVVWDIDKVSLNIPGGNLRTGEFESTVTWILTGAADA